VDAFGSLPGVSIGITMADLNGVVVGYADCYSKGLEFEFRVRHGPFQKV
jgi:hypothetical protein